MDQLLPTTPQQEVEVIRNAAHKKRRWHMEFLVEWLEFAACNGCISSGHAKELYQFFCRTIHTISIEHRDVVFDTVLCRVKEIIYTVPAEERVFVEEPYVASILKGVAQQREDNIDLLFYEHGLAVVSSTALPYPLFLKQYVATCTKALLTVYGLSDADIQNPTLCVVMEAIYIKILKKRSEKISTLSCNAILSSQHLTRQSYVSLATFLCHEFSTLPAGELCKFTGHMDGYFNYNPAGQQLCLTSKSVYSLAKLMYKTHGGVEVLKDGSLIRFFTDALGDEQRAETHKQGKLCLLRTLCLYLKFCITHKITLRNHEFARWVVALCDRCSSGTMR